MKLSENLVKQFVKATKDDAPKKTEYYVYGTATAHVADNHIDVIFDGAKEPTPCTTSVTVEDGDRVLVMIKNRQAVITSNVSKPTVNADYLEAGEAKISGTIHAARYEDTTGNFTMDIGAVKSSDAEGAPLSPAFSIKGYFDGDPNNQYAELVIHFQPAPESGSDYDRIPRIPTMWIEGSIRDNPDDIYDSHVNVGIGPQGIQFNGEYNTIENGKHVMYKNWTNLNWQNSQRYEES